jgi:hypothetical protein
MAHYTTTIRTLLNHDYDLGLKDYPIFDENYRAVLNKKILDHYLENEIGFETPALFKHFLNSTMNEIMPYYNTLYTKQVTLIDKLETNVNLREEYRGNSSTQNTSQSTSSSAGQSNSKNLFQDTPQGSLDTTDLDNQSYATNVTFDKNNTSTSITDNSSNNGKGTNDYIKTIVGNNGGRYSIDILNDIKNNLMNIDLMIINDLNTLFMQIY